MQAKVLFLLVLGALNSASPGVAQDGQYAFVTLAGLAGAAGSANGTNEVARFNFPGGIAVDAAGNLYVADILNHTIRKITPNGTNSVVTTLAGLAGTPGSADGTNAQALFNRPNGVALGPSGELFVVDHYNHTIRKMTLDGADWIVTTIAGQAGAPGTVDGTNGSARFWSPTGIAVSSRGEVFVADTAAFTIRRLSPVGTNWVVSTVAGLALNYGFVDGTNSDAEFDYPYGIAANRADDFFVTDWGNHAIRQIRELGGEWVTQTIAGASGQIGSIDGPGAVASLNFPNGICTDLAGNVYAADQSNNTIRKIAPIGDNWVVSTIGGLALQAGTSDGLGQASRFRHPWGIATDVRGDLYVTDYGNQTIRKGVFLPYLRVNLVAGRVVLSWSTAAADFAAEKSDSLAPEAVWSPLTNVPATNGLRLVLSDSPGDGSVFYRLSRQ